MRHATMNRLATTAPRRRSAPRWRTIAAGWVLGAIAVAACLGAPAAGAERESLTLTDGRTLVGVYDADAGTVALDGKGSAVVKVRADQVKTHEPAPMPKPAAAAAGPAPATAEAAAPAKPHRETAAEIMADSAVASAAEEARHQQVGRELFAQRRARVAAWLMKANLDPIPLAPIGSDPRQSEVQAHELAEKFNATLAELRSIRDQALHDPARAASADATLSEIHPGPMLELLRDR